MDFGALIVGIRWTRVHMVESLALAILAMWRVVTLEGLPAQVCHAVWRDWSRPGHGHTRQTWNEKNGEPIYEDFLGPLISAHIHPIYSMVNGLSSPTKSHPDTKADTSGTLGTKGCCYELKESKNGIITSTVWQVEKHHRRNQLHGPDTWNCHRRFLGFCYSLGCMAAQWWEFQHGGVGRAYGGMWLESCWFTFLLPKIPFWRHFSRYQILLLSQLSNFCSKLPPRGMSKTKIHELRTHTKIPRFKFQIFFEVSSTTAESTKSDVQAISTKAIDWP